QYAPQRERPARRRVAGQERRGGKDCGICDAMPYFAVSCLRVTEYPRDPLGQALPVLSLLGKLLFSSSGQRVHASLPSFLREAPLRLNQPLLLHAMQGRV